MNCELNLVPLSCDRTGVGFSASPLSADSNRLRLLKGHGKHFPQIARPQYFYVRIAGCNNCCEVAKVVDIDGDVLVLDRTSGSKCECVQSNAMVEYEWNNLQVIKDIASSIGLNVVSPLKYDACTRTLSVDCKELFAADCGGCGCGEGVPEQPVPQGGGTGARGPRGEKGEAGVGIAEFTISPAGKLLYTLTDGSSRSAGTLPQAKGTPGEQGPRGVPGEQGPKGEDGATLATATMQNTNMVFTMSNGDTVSLDATPLKGEKGDDGEQGPKGEKGDPGYSFQYVDVGSKSYIFGTPKTQVSLKSPQMPGLTLGPYTTDANGFAEFDKPQMQGKALIQLFVDSKLVGIGGTS